MSSTENIATLVSPRCAGIIWITKEKVDLNHPNVYELNYLLDGLLIQTLKEEYSTSENNHFFLSENFGKPFFIGQVIDSSTALKIIEQHLDIMVPLISESSEIYILNQSEKYQSILKDLQKKYPQLTFKKI